MSQNDLIHLESHFENWKQSRGKGLRSVDPFLFYATEQFLKPFDLSDEEILYGIVDGGDDGGIDAIYFLANRGELIREDTEINPKTDKVHLVVFQVKSSGGFSANAIEKLILTTEDLLDLSRSAASISNRYHLKLLSIFRSFKEKYLTIAGNFPSLTVDYYYVTKADEVQPDNKANDAAGKVIDGANRHMNRAQCEFHFKNAQALLAQVMVRPTRERTLIWVEAPMQTREGYVGLAKLKDYFEFIKADDGTLAEMIFESNVRGFQQNTPVNKQIRDSLKDSQGVNFWLLNNGITIVASRTQNAGHLHLSLEDPQIVNGLQTSREIFTYFSEIGENDDSRSILVRVIQTEDDVVRDSVVKATNSQNKMPPYSLRATDPIHHQIEELFKKYQLYYDRRKGFYKDKGKPISRIVSVTELLQAAIAVVVHRPDDARARPGDYITDDDKYASVFENNLPLGVYLSTVQIARRVDDFLESCNVERGEQRNLKYYVAFYVVCALTDSLAPNPEGIIAIEEGSIKDELLRDIYARVLNKYKKLGANDTVARGPDLLRKLRTEMKKRKIGSSRGRLTSRSD
jgi:hypothetical protein